MPTINVANLVANVGANLTEFNLGMQNVEAGLRQVEARSNKTSQRLQTMATQASRYNSAADTIAAQRQRATTSGTQFSRQADEFARRRREIETGHSDFDRRITALQSEQSQLDISPLIRNLRVADTELNAAIAHQKKLQSELQTNIGKATQTAVDASVGTATKDLEHQTALFNAAQLKMREAEAKLNVARSIPNSSAISAAEKQVLDAQRKHIEAQAATRSASTSVDEIRYYDPKQVGIAAALRSQQSAVARETAARVKVAETQTALATARGSVNQKSIDVSAKQMETATAHFAAAEVKLQQAQERLKNAAIVDTTKATAQINKELNDATKAYTDAQKKFESARRAVGAHGVLATGLQDEEQRVRDAAQKEIDNLRRQESEKRLQHSSYIGNLASREASLRQRATDTTARIDPAREEAEATQEAARTRIALQAQHAREQRNQAMSSVGTSLMVGGAAVTAGLVAATKIGADYNQQMLLAQHNTSLTTEGMETMRSTVAKLGLESGASLVELTQGFRLIENFGFDAAKSTDLLEISMHAAVATGADLSQTSELLAKAIKEFNIPVEDAGKAMAVMVTAANRSSLEMDQMVHVGGQLYATAANLGVSFVEANAALVTYTKHGLSASEASTQLRNDIQKIIAPSKQVRDALGALDKQFAKKTGINLSRDFSPQGLRSKGVSGVFDDVAQIAKLKEALPQDLGTKLFPNLRGTVGAIIGLGSGFKDLHDDITALNDVVKNGADPVLGKYNDTVAQTNQQIARAKNALTLASAEVERVFSPAVIAAAGFVGNLAKQFGDLDAESRRGYIQFVAFGGGALIVTGALVKTAAAVNTLNAATIALGGTGIRGLISGFGAATLAAAPLIVALAATGGVLVYEIKRFYEIAHAQEIATAAAKDTAAQNVASAQSGYNNARSVGSMVAQYREMEAQSLATNKPVEGMQHLLDQIAAASPGLVSGYDAQGHAISLMGDAAEITTRKLADMAAQTRASLANQEKLEQARTGDDINAHRRALLQAQREMNTPVHEPNNPGWARSLHNFGRPLDDPGMTAAQQNAARQRALAEEAKITELTAKYNQLGAHAETYGVIPHTIASARNTETDRLYEAYDILRNKLRETTNAYTEFHRAQKGDDTVVRENLAYAKSEFKVVKDELDIRRKSMLELKAHTTPGADPLAGLGKKEPKAKKPKKTDEERQMEEYLRTMEGIRQNEFIAVYQGEDGEHAKEAQALWETQTHGAIMYNGVLKEINGSFYDIKQTEKDALIAASKKQDVDEATRKAGDKYKDFKRDSLLDALKDPDGLNASPEMIEAYKLKSGYYKSYGKDAPAVAKTNQGLAEKQIAKDKEALLKRIEDEVEKYGQKEISVHDQVVKSLNDDREAYRKLTKEEIDAYATRAQSNDDFATSSKQFSESSKKAIDDLHELQNGGKEQSEQSRISLELQNKEYAKMAPLTKTILTLMYARNDAQRHANDLAKESGEAHRLMSDNLDDAQDRLKNAGNPKEDEYYAYHAKVIDKYSETLKDASMAKVRDINNEIRANFENVYSLEQQAKAAEEVYNINKQVKDGLKELTQHYVVNTDGLKITVEQWKKMTAQEKEAVKQFQKFSTLKDMAKDAVQGIGEIFAKELNNIRDHGFKNFFSDVLNMFNDMLFNMAVQWAQAQITKSLTGLLGGIIGAAAGGAGVGSSIAGAVSGGSEGSGAIGDIPAVTRAAAVGGSIPSDAPTLVGERGPELFMPGRAGTIIPNNALDGLGGGSVNVEMHIHGVGDLQSWQNGQTQYQVTQRLATAIQSRQSGGRR